MSSSNPMFGRPAASFFSTFSWMILAAIAALIYSSTKAKSSPVNQDRFIARRAEVRGRGIKREAGCRNGSGDRLPLQHQTSLVLHNIDVERHIALVFCFCFFFFFFSSIPRV
ncbi:hypothetical protein CAOG_009304 [Capsaspora owczarzaki ATCC 30864]|uniref:Uncharacterized protein n=1 Tax=Capsaspora owczarzaki (strain ATCC 30864) TaxID=595528 RepID=A0A0D2VG50_CAPO3|nr:hypothetical protein CAOG_009304 [Capsaspora owczarzaki ATCC 30864]